jgi:hypothetical protein
VTARERFALAVFIKLFGALGARCVEQAITSNSSVTLGRDERFRHGTREALDHRGLDLRIRHNRDRRLETEAASKDRGFWRCAVDQRKFGRIDLKGLYATSLVAPAVC